MNVFKLIDQFLFGAADEQEGANKLDKLYFYLPMSFVIAIALYIKVGTGF